MPTAHLIHGFLGAGKTTFARRLETDLPAIRFTHDEWMARLYGEDSPEALFADRFERVSSLIDRVWQRCVTLGLDVVLDLGFWTRSRRDAVRAEAMHLGGEVRLYSLAVPEAEAWRRIERRNRCLDGSLFIAPETFEILKRRFEPLAPDEERIVMPS